MRPLYKLFLFTPCAVAVMALNLVRESALARQGDQMAEAARLSVTEPIPYSYGALEDRHFQALRARFIPRPDALVLGSSRAMQITANCVPGARLVNASLSGGEIQDAAALLLAYRSAGKSPKLLVLGLDPFQFEHYSGGWWKALSGHYLNWLEAERMPVPLEARWAAWEERNRPYSVLLSPSGVRPALDLLLARTAGRVAEDPSPGFWRDVDGSRIPRLEPRVARALVPLPDGRVTPVRHRLGPSISPGNIRLAGALMDSARKDGIRIVVWLAPFHPAVYAEEEQMGARISQREALVRRLAAERGIPVVGSYSPEHYNATAADFSDGSHPLTRLVSRIFAEAASLLVAPAPPV